MSMKNRKLKLQHRNIRKDKNKQQVKAKLKRKQRPSEILRMETNPKVQFQSAKKILMKASDRQKKIRFENNTE